MKRINIAISLDDGYVRYAGVLLISLFEHHREHEIDIYVLSRIGGLGAESREMLAALAEEANGQVYFMEIDAVRFPAFFLKVKNWPVEAFLRLALPELLPEDMERLLYLDCDIVVKECLDELYFMDFDDKSLIVCRDLGSEIPFHDVRDEIFSDKIGKEEFTYFCSGMMLWNVPEVRKAAAFQNYMQLAEELEYRLQAPDQDLLNLVFWNKTKVVDEIRYNAFSQSLLLANVNYSLAKRVCAIIHFSGGKPWSGKEGKQLFDVELLWWDYARKSPYYVEFLQELGAAGMARYGKLRGYKERAAADPDLIREMVRMVRQCGEGIGAGLKMDRQSFAAMYELIMQVNLVAFGDYETGMAELSGLISRGMKGDGAETRERLYQEIMVWSEEYDSILP